MSMCSVLSGFVLRSDRYPGVRLYEEEGSNGVVFLITLPKAVFKDVGRIVLDKDLAKDTDELKFFVDKMDEEYRRILTTAQGMG